MDCFNCTGCQQRHRITLQRMCQVRSQQAKAKSCTPSGNGCLVKWPGTSKLAVLQVSNQCHANRGLFWLTSSNLRLPSHRAGNMLPLHHDSQALLPTGTASQANERHSKCWNAVVLVPVQGAAPTSSCWGSTAWLCWTCKVSCACRSALTTSQWLSLPTLYVSSSLPHISPSFYMLATVGSVGHDTVALHLGSPLCASRVLT